MVKPKAYTREFSALCFILCLSLLFPFFIQHRTTFLADVTYNVEPTYKFLSTYFLQGKAAPLWNPYVLLGVPQIAVGWPLFYLPGAFSGIFSFGFGTGVFMVTHLLIAGVGGFAWQLRNTEINNAPSFNSVIAASFFAFGFMLSGYMVGCQLNLGLMAAVSYVPVALYLIDRFVNDRRFWHPVLLALVFGMQFQVGRPELALASTVMCLGYFGWSIRGKELIQPAALLVLSLFLGSCISAIDYLPLLELKDSCPPAAQYSVLKSSFWSAGAQDWLGILFMKGKLLLNQSRDAVTYEGYIPYVTSLFLGPIPIFFSCIALRYQFRKSLFWLVVALVSAVVACGQFGPLGALFDNQMVIRYPIKFAVFTLFGLQVLATIGWRHAFSNSNIFDRSGPLCRTNLLWFAGLCSIALIMGSVDFIRLLRAGDMAISNHDLPVWSLLLTAMTGISVTLILRKATIMRQALVCSLFVINLWVNAALQISNNAPSTIFQRYPRALDLLKDLKITPESEQRFLCLVDDADAPLQALNPLKPDIYNQEVMRYSREILRPNTNMDWLIKTLNGVSVIPTWSSLFLDIGLIPRSTLSTENHPLGKSDEPLYRYCQATSTACVETSLSDDGTHVLPKLDDQFFDLALEDNQLNIRMYNVSDIRKRFCVLSQYRYAPKRMDALTYINHADVNDYDPLDSVVITAEENDLISAAALSKQSPAEPTEGSRARIGKVVPLCKSDQLENASISTPELDSAHKSPGAFSVDLNLPAKMVFVVTEGYAPGWKVEDNGRRVPLFIADGVMQAVILDAGTHKLNFRYAPDSVRLGALISCSALVLLAVMLLGGWYFEVRTRRTSTN